MALSNWVLVVITCFALLQESHASSHSCPREIKNCSCSDAVMMCDYKRYTSFPENISPNYTVRDLRVVGNNLTQIKNDHFTHFTGMENVFLRQNQISSITEQAFYQNKLLHTIDLSHNSLSSLPLNLFKRLTSLQNVHLNNNQLKVIKSAHFQGLVSLKEIRLHDNLLKKVGSEAFIDSPDLSVLYLETNQLKTPEKNWLLHFDHLKRGYELYMDDNPWSCDCRMQEFYDWAITKKWFAHAQSQDRVSIPKCQEPPNLKGVEMSTIASPSKLICEGAKIVSTSEDASVFEGTRVHLECNATGFPKPIVSITDPKGRILVKHAGAVKYELDSPTASDSGEYTCNASGHVDSKTFTYVKAVIDVNVHKHPAPVVSVVLLCLLVAAVLLGVGVWYYKRYRPRTRYGRLPNDPKFTDNQIASYARNNSESMRVSLSRPNGQSAHQSAIASQMNRDGKSDDDDDITEYHKDTEYLV